MSATAMHHEGHLGNDPEVVYHCFAGETSYLTIDGERTFSETAGTTQMVLTSRWTDGGASRFGGRWVEAEIRSFGEQPLMTVTLQRNRRTKIIRATAEHRWLLRNDSKYASNRVVVTSDLRPGQRLSYLFPSSRIRQTVPSPVGVMAGVVFGDGTRTAHGTQVSLWGAKDAELLRYFPEATTRTPIKTPNDVEGVFLAHLPRFFKDRPPLDEGTSYLYGWLAGYFAADGSVTAQGQVSLTSARREDLEFVRTLATRLGIGTFGISSKLRQGYGDPSELHSVEFVGSTLTEAFFLIAAHRERFSARDYGFERLGWTVQSVEDTGEVEEVFCAVVPDTESFVLSDNIYSLNCPFCGSGALVGGPDGAVTCGICEKTYMVFIQPTFSGTPADQAPGGDGTAGGVPGEDEGATPGQPVPASDALGDAPSFTAPDDSLANVPAFQLATVAGREAYTDFLAARIHI